MRDSLHVVDYDNKAKFYPECVKERIKEHNIGILGMVACVGLMLLGLGGRIVETRMNPKKAKQNIEQVSKVVTDTVKALPKDTIAPFKTK